MVLKALALILATVWLTGCLEEQGKSSEIVIPPGSLLQFDMTKVNPASTKKFSLYLTEFIQAEKKTKNLLDMTTDAKPDFIRSIMPKGLSPSGAMVLKVVMEYRTLPWYAIVYPDAIIQPSLDTTLVYNLLSTYPGRDLSTYTPDEIQKITAAVIRFREERLALFGISPDFNPDLLYRFIRNGLSNSYDFLTFMKSFGVEFVFNNDGDVTVEPYPFGILNRPPVLDEKATTKVQQQRVEEGKKIEIRATARDPDGDQVFYAWMLEGALRTAEEGIVRWDPSYDDGRPDPYTMSVILSDGGKISRVDWPVLVENVNRRPTYTYSCPATVNENAEWVCLVKFKDEDGDAIKVVADAISGSNPLYLNNQMAPTEINDAGEVTVRWTPNNEDARKGLNSIMLEVTDALGGLTLASLQVSVQDTNSAPIMLGGVNPIADSAIEYDYCANEVPDGVAPYQFYLDFQDVDNIGPNAASPPDELIVTTAGTLKSYITQVGLPEILPDRVRYTFLWKPLHTLKTGTFIVTLKDNHNGAAAPITLNLTAADRNTKPCLAGADQTVQVKSSQIQNSITYTVSDKDNDPLWLEAYDFSMTGTNTNKGAIDSLTNIVDCGTNQMLILRRMVGMAEPTYRRNASSFCIRIMNNSVDIAGGGAAGYVRFVRSSEDTSARTFATTNTFTVPGSNIVFKPKMNVTINAGDLEVLFPVVADGTTAAANTVTVIATTVPAGVTVTNPAALYDRGIVTFSRPTTTAAITIPKMTVVRTAGRLIEFETPDDIVMPIGTASVSIPVWRKPVLIADGTVLTSSNLLAGAPAFTVSAVSGTPSAISPTLPHPPGLYDWNEHAVQRGTSNQVDIYRKFRVRALDGYRAAAKAINTFVDTLPPEAANLKVENTGVFEHQGIARFFRPTGTTAINLPAGTRVRTANYTYYELIDPLVMPVGTLTINRWVRRVENQGWTTTAPIANNRLATLRFTDVNNPSIVVSNPTIIATQGTNLQDGLIQMADSALKLPSPYYALDDYWYPLDPKDYYTFTVEKIGTGPVGQWSVCRTTGLANSACTGTNVCSTVPAAADQTYFKTNRCYFRYTPHASDYSGNFSFKVTAVERSSWGTLSTVTNVTLVVKEINTKPVLTNSSFTPLAGGSGAALGTPLTLGDFNEGTESLYNIYAVDNNKGSELQTVNFDLDAQVYDLKTSTWVPRPEGLSVAVEKREALTPGPGSKTTAKLVWNPTDADSKKFSGTAGLVVKMRVYDAKTMPDVQQSTDAFYKIRLINKNQVPSIAEIVSGNNFRIFADTYFSQDVYLYDNDAYVPNGGSFSTLLTLCRDANGVALRHPTLDPVSADPYVCHANSTTWAPEIATYDATYKRNVSVPQCGDGTNLNADLAVPKLTPVGVPELVGSTLRQRYKMEWCPQRTHIGEHSAELFVNDNGDVDRDGLALSRSASATPLRINVVAPAYFISPRQNLSGTPVHFMPHTAASMPSAPFKYPVIVNNSQGNSLEYSLVTSPRPCAEANGMCIDPTKGIISWNPAYPADVTAEGGAGHQVRVRVRDLKTQETDTVSFYLKVQNPLSPFEASPVINSFLPAGTDVLASEKTPVSFSISASDPNSNDTLFYRWYVNDELRYDEGPNFEFKAKDTDASIDPDGSGPLKAGEFMVRAEATDGNYVATKEWKVKIRNNYLLAEKLFDIFAARPESLPSMNPLALNWLAEVPVTLNLGSNIVDHLVFAGTYTLGMFTKHFLWDLTLVNGAMNKPNGTLVNPPWNFMEDLPWLSGTQTKRMALVKTSGSFDILLTSQTGRVGPFGLTTEALRIPATDLTGLSLGTGNKCIGDCPQNLFTSNLNSDLRLTESLDSAYVFYASDNGDKLMYDYLNPASAVQIYNFGTAKISGMVLNKNLERLYVATQQTSPSISHKLFVFNVSNVRSGGTPGLVAQITLWDGVAGHQDCKPTDLVVDVTSHRVLALLTGTGGVAVLTDGPAKTPTDADVQFVGVNEISSSPFDVPGQGRRLVIRPEDRMIIGTMKDANQVFTIDLDSYQVYANSVQDPVDSIVSFDSGQILLVSRSKGRIYRAR
ncbi:hypothetical protein ACES2I_14340 [Bdellovibrio bacteriovorus]|uniref:hypothetical protein n=1 Tax=Bdellovibrio bacteriovorus TaxID=959 RepID=UPI0035A63BB1